MPAAANRLSVAATGLVPGDTVSRVVTLSNTGDQALAGIGLTTTASPSSKLDTDAVMGLQLQVDACSAPLDRGRRHDGLHLHLHRHQSAVLAPACR